MEGWHMMLAKIGTGELIVILLIAVFVVGPERLPKLAKSFGKAIAGVKKYMNSVTEELTEDEELKDLSKEIKQIRKDLNSTVDDLKKVTKQTVDDAAKEAEQAAKETAEEISSIEKEVKETTKIPETESPGKTPEPAASEETVQ